MSKTLIVMTIILILISSPFVYSAYNKRRLAQWDEQIVEMCESEGGITVYETVDVSPELNPELIFTRNGVSIRNEQYIDSDDPYFLRTEFETLRQSNPVIRKGTYKLIRAHDMFVVGKSVIFSRDGGDFPRFNLGTGTSFTCSDIPDFEINLISAVFNIIGDEL